MDSMFNAAELEKEAAGYEFMWDHEDAIKEENRRRWDGATRLKLERGRVFETLRQKTIKKEMFDRAVYDLQRALSEYDVELEKYEPIIME